MIKDKQGGGNIYSDGKESPAATMREEVIQDSHRGAEEVTKLKERLTECDNEISILWHGAASLVSLRLNYYYYKFFLLL